MLNKYAQRLKSSDEQSEASKQSDTINLVKKGQFGYRHILMMLFCKTVTQTSRAQLKQSYLLYQTVNNCDQHIILEKFSQNEGKKNDETVKDSNLWM